MFPRLRELLFGQKVSVRPEVPLTEAQRRLAEKFKVGIAEALGVPPEAINQEVVERWIREWTKAFVKPEFWAEAITSISDEQAYNLGRLWGELLLDLIKESHSG
jgi:hypothetical protein